jgi:hypothetical protein
MRNLSQNGGVVLGLEIIRKGIWPSSLPSLRRSFLLVNEVKKVHEKFAKWAKKNNRPERDVKSVEAKYKQV